ncbi:MAG: hypothetical protein KDD40_12805, partial [Bdellovibrionales bacterium]|nr:hypothetical protein [Bdellovibrionales bacterium]
MVLRYNKCKTFAYFILLCLLSFSTLARTETMFEGYYQIRLGGVHSGFVIQRYSFDSAKKLFSSTYYIRTNQLAGNITESLKATANDKFEPITYQYTSKTGNVIKTIDATFKNTDKGPKMTAVVSDGKMGNKIEKDLPKGTFLSTFLAYMMLSRGISMGKVYSYQGIAEEDAADYPGKAKIQEQND